MGTQAPPGLGPVGRHVVVPLCGASDPTPQIPKLDTAPEKGFRVMALFERGRTLSVRQQWVYS